MTHNPQLDNEQLSYSLPEAAAIVGVSVRTLYAYMDQGVLKTFKLGGRRLVKRAALEQFLSAAEAA